MNKRVHFNCDVAEGVGNEAQLMPHLSACNIACGAHAGNDTLIANTIKLALQYQVEIGAHPGFPDRENFGRKKMTISWGALRESIEDQIVKVRAIASQLGTTVYHIKPHGALYNLAAKDEDYAKLLIAVIQSIDDQLILFTPYNSVIAQMAEGKLKTMIEGFADRNYTDTYALVSRDIDNAVITVPEDVYAHVKMMLSSQLKTHSGNTIPFTADTLCVHGDTPNSEAILKYIATRLEQEKYEM